MKTFKVTIAATLKAEDIDDVISELASHFRQLDCYGIKAESPFLPGSKVDIRPVEP
jgi:hypothetical protein